MINLEYYMFINALIPLVIGFLLLKNPEIVFLGSKSEPTEEKLNKFKKIGKVLIVVGIVYALIGIVRLFA